jgi:hypothetical protein
LFRLIHRYGITPIIDEVQRLKGERREDLDDIFLSGDQKNRPIVRTNMNTLKTEAFRIYGPMIISKRAGGYTAEDMDNRSITIKMIENRSKKIDPSLDTEELAAIRNDLYALYALYMVHPEAFKFEEFLKESIRQLTEKDDRGRTVCDVTYEIGKELRGRMLDIATTYYTLSRLTSTELDTLSLLTDEQHYTSERQKDGLEADITHSMMLCWEGYTKEYNQTKKRYSELLCRVPTKNITEMLNSDQRDKQNRRINTDHVSGHKVTRTIRDMGFEIRIGQGNLSFIKWTKDLDELLDLNVDKFGSEEDRAILDRMRRIYP